ncbi:MAG: AMP-binding protein [Acidimicrobiia bacterium]|jgi:acyl-CoA synthetase (AMP-forming)/AMP-acid ligase II
MALLIGNAVRGAAAVAASTTAATLGDDAITYGELDARSNRVAHALRGLGIRHGDRVVWWGETSLEALPIFAAVAKLGAVFAPLNARYGAAEAERVAGYARPSLLVADAAHAELASGWDLLKLDHAQLFALADAASADAVHEPALDERDPHVIFFTSGSTGRPKGVILSHRANYLRSISNPTGDSAAATVCMFPLFHMAGWSMAMGAFQSRRPLHFVTTADPGDLLRAVERHRATRLYLIPAVWNRVLEHDWRRYDLSSLREADTGTSATPPELVAAIRDAFPSTITRIVYGSTEAGPGTVLPHADVLRKPGSVGLASPGVFMRLSERGEVCITSDFLMDGYFEQPDETAEALQDGWYHTGDLGSLDHEGYLSIVGRARDVLRTGGETVAPLEVEDALRDHPAIAEVAVVGIPDVDWGEVVCAVVVAVPGREHELDVDGLRAHCRDRLAGYKHPRRVELVDALPRTPATGQIQRTLIVERITSAGR